MHNTPQFEAEVKKIETSAETGQRINDMLSHSHSYVIVQTESRSIPIVSDRDGNIGLSAYCCIPNAELVVVDYKKAIAWAFIPYSLVGDEKVISYLDDSGEIAQEYARNKVNWMLGAYFGCFDIKYTTTGRIFSDSNLFYVIKNKNRVPVEITTKEISKAAIAYSIKYRNPA